MTTAATAPAPLWLTNNRRGRRLVLSAHGRIDHVTATRLGWVFSRVAGGEPVALDLCVAEVTDTSGTVLLLNAMRRLHARQRELIVVCAQPSLRQALDRTGLARRFEVLGDVDALPDPPLRLSAARHAGEDAARVVVGRLKPRASTAPCRM